MWCSKARRSVTANVTENGLRVKCLEEMSGHEAVAVLIHHDR